MNTTLTPEMQLYIGLAIAAAVTIIAILFSRRRGIEVLAHRGFFILPEADEKEKPAPPAGPHWFVKIFNHTSKPVVITHVGWCDDGYYPCVGRRLPARIAPGGVIETWISEAEIGDHLNFDTTLTASKFRVLDAAGRRYTGRLNVNVAPAGFVA